MTKTVTLEFHPASDPPDTDRSVICVFANNNGEPSYVSIGWFWINKWMPGENVISWADKPDAKECVPSYHEVR